MVEEEEAVVEIEAALAVYGGDCHVTSHFPPHLHVHIKPRTADDSSQQFVQIILAIRADDEYPKEPPLVDIIEAKGLDDKRQEHLVTSLRDKAQELASGPMIVALCEEAVEILSNMNHPDGDCPLCLYPLVPDDTNSNFLPFMKLMSCFHCFHSDCIVRWWRWLQEQNETLLSNSIEPNATSIDLENGRSSEIDITVKQCPANCPVCRKVFQTKDIEHVLDLLGTSSSQSIEGTDTNDDEKEFLQSEAENNRRKNYAAVLKLQEENMGLIESKRNNVLLPGVFLPQPVTVLVASTQAAVERQDEGCESKPPPELDLSSSSNKPHTSKHSNTSWRKNRSNYPRRQTNAQPSRKQWVKKEKMSSD